VQADKLSQLAILKQLPLVLWQQLSNSFDLEAVDCGAPAQVCDLCAAQQMENGPQYAYITKCEYKLTSFTLLNTTIYRVSLMLIRIA